MDGNVHFLHMTKTPHVGAQAVLFRIETVSVREDGAAIVEGRGLQKVEIEDYWVEEGESAAESLFFAKFPNSVRVK